MFESVPCLWSVVSKFLVAFGCEMEPCSNCWPCSVCVVMEFCLALCGFCVCGVLACWLGSESFICLIFSEGVSDF